MSNGPRVPGGNPADPFPIVNSALDVYAHQEAYAIDPVQAQLLTFYYLGGSWGSFDLADGSVTLTDNAENYVVIERTTGILSASTTTTNWANLADYARAWHITTLAGVRTTTRDRRSGPGGVHGSVDNSTPPSLALDDLTDVNVPAPADGDVLVWDDLAAEWVAAAPSGGGGLTDITESLNTASPNNVDNVVALTVTGGTVDTYLALVPKGTAGLLLAVPDGTATGGNIRGNYAVDLQRVRNAATKVASGASSFVAGQQNTASGAFSVAIGNGNTASEASSVAVGSGNTVSSSSGFGWGSSNTVSGAIGAAAGGVTCTASGSYSLAVGNSAQASAESAVAFGDNSRATGIYSFVIGSQGDARNTTGAFVHSSSRKAVRGDCQHRTVTMREETTNATPGRMSSDGGAAVAVNQMVMPGNSAQSIRGRVVAFERTTGDTKAWVFTAITKYTGGVFSLVASVTPTVDAADTGAAAWTITVTADNTLKAINVTVIGEAAKSIDWVASIEALELAD